MTAVRASVIVIAGTLVALLSTGGGARAATIVVSSAGDPGDGVCDVAECTLREAIAASNASVGVYDTIAFSIGSGAQTIVVGSPTVGGLEAITDPVNIDATTQPGFGGSPLVEIRPATDIGNPFPDGLLITGGGSTIRGLAISSFEGYGIQISQTGGNFIAGNYLGTDLNGNEGGWTQNGFADVRVYGSQGNVVGGSSDADRNLIGQSISITGTGATANSIEGNFIGTDAAGLNSNLSAGGVGIVDAASGNSVGAPGAGNVISGRVVLESPGNVVRSNFVGVNATGMTSFNNPNSEVEIRASNNTIGGVTPGSGNVIGGGRGVMISEIGITNNQVLGNFIGTDATGSLPLPTSYGVQIVDAHGNTVGGTEPGEANLIAHSKNGPVTVSGLTATGNTIRGNSIYSSQFGLGIRNLNGGNTELPPPQVSGEGPLSGTACPNCIIDIYSDNATEGRTYHGAVTADSSGDWSFGGIYNGPKVTTTATDANGNTSAFSAPLSCADPDSDLVCNPADDNDDGDGFSDTLEGVCGSDTLNNTSIPERVDGSFTGVDDDGDTQIDEPLPAGAAFFDCDGDGYKGSAEAGTPLCGNTVSGNTVNDDGVVFGGSDDATIDDGCPGGPPVEGAYSEAQFNIGTSDQDPCGGNGWPSELLSGGITHNKITLQDVTSFVAPAPRKYQTNPGAPGFNSRWDLFPGRSGATTWIALNDILSLVAGPSGSPPMLGGAKAFNGPACPWAP